MRGPFLRTPKCFHITLPSIYKSVKTINWNDKVAQTLKKIRKHVKCLSFGYSIEFVQYNLSIIGWCLPFTSWILPFNFKSVWGREMIVFRSSMMFIYLFIFVVQIFSPNLCGLFFHFLHDVPWSWCCFPLEKVEFWRQMQE